MRYEMQFVDLQVQHTAVVRGHVAQADIGEFLGSAFAEIINALDEQGCTRPGHRSGGTAPSTTGWTSRSASPAPTSSSPRAG